MDIATLDLDELANNAKYEIFKCIDTATKKHTKELRKRCFEYNIKYVVKLPPQIIRTGLGKPLDPGNQGDLYLDLSPYGCTYIYDKFFGGWVEMIATNNIIACHAYYRLLNSFYMGEKDYV